METINWIEHEEKGSWERPNLVAYALIEAMCDVAGTDVENTFSPFDSKALNVEFRVNGVELSFVGVMTRIQKAVETLEDDIRASIIKDAANKLMDELRDKVDSWD